ncbi:hypothetical protein [Aegicerativicinus sediminis]|uniref:hypothetical protein n=1 Tax=Aegicerativicinus sediminis TaxID=2893202 RepID=UPI001E428038|nr:hypothetical protein [Aegicerativicinus sediminis]
MSPKTKYTETYKAQLCRRFHDEHIGVKNYLKRDRPGKFEINQFLKKNLTPYYSDFQDLLAMYIFEFWSLAYCIKPPSEERIMSFVINFNENRTKK